MPNKGVKRQIKKRSVEKWNMILLEQEIEGEIISLRKTITGTVILKIKPKGENKLERIFNREWRKAINNGNRDGNNPYRLDKDEKNG